MSFRQITAVGAYISDFKIILVKEKVGQGGEKLN